MFEGKTVLITGGTGSLGTALTKRLLENNVKQIRICSQMYRFEICWHRSAKVNRFRICRGVSRKVQIWNLYLHFRNLNLLKKWDLGVTDSKSVHSRSGVTNLKSVGKIVDRFPKTQIPELHSPRNALCKSVQATRENKGPDPRFWRRLAAGLFVHRPLI